MLRRRALLKSAVGAAALAAVPKMAVAADDVKSAGVRLQEPLPGEDIFAYLLRTSGRFEAARYKQILGAANPFKEGDQIVGVAAADEASCSRARSLLAVSLPAMV